jgi:signal transduction histidine kinase
LLRCSGPTTDRRIGQPTILHRVLLNLVTNALKYTNTGTVTLSATAVGATSLCFQVDDSGRGMPEAVVAALTTPVGGGPIGGGPIGGGPVFSEAFSGSGLGLGICRRLLGDLDSELEIESLRPTGTRVQFTLALPAL